MTSKIHVSVTEEDIKSGIPVKASYCPIALALRRETTTSTIAVGSFYANLGIQKFALPVEARKFIRDFDMGLSVAPFEFDMEERLYNTLY